MPKILFQSFLKSKFSQGSIPQTPYFALYQTSYLIQNNYNSTKIIPECPKIAFQGFWHRVMFQTFNLEDFLEILTKVAS